MGYLENTGQGELLTTLGDEGKTICGHLRNLGKWLVATWRNAGMMNYWYLGTGEGTASCDYLEKPVKCELWPLWGTLER